MDQQKKARDKMITYLLAFGVILIILISAVFVHMCLGLGHVAKKTSSNEASRPAGLDEILFSN